MKKTIVIKGTHCEACKALIEDVCKNIKGILSCNVDFRTGNTIIEHYDNLDLNALKEEIERLGNYKVEIWHEKTNQ